MAMFITGFDVNAGKNVNPIKIAVNKTATTKVLGWKGAILYFMYRNPPFKILNTIIVINVAIAEPTMPSTGTKIQFVKMVSTTRNKLNQRLYLKYGDNNKIELFTEVSISRIFAIPKNKIGYFIAE